MVQRIPPKPGQESVWDYPRPPRLEPSSKHIQIVFNGVTIADTTRAYRILETSHPPAYYLLPEDCQMQYFHQIVRRTFCEFKGAASYYDITVNGRTARSAAWYYATPTAPYRDVANYLAFYPALMDVCYVDGEQVQSQEGDFYGGWITSDIVGPFKGAPGTWGW